MDGSKEKMQIAKSTGEANLKTAKSGARLIRSHGVIGAEQGK